MRVREALQVRMDAAKVEQDNLNKMQAIFAKVTKSRKATTTTIREAS